MATLEITSWYNVHQVPRSDWVVRRALTPGNSYGCALADVSIAIRGEPTFLSTFPCFSCSGVTVFKDYYARAEAWLAEVVYYLHSPHVDRSQAKRVAEEVTYSVLGDYRFDCAGPSPGNTIHVVDINIWPHIMESAVNRTVLESFEEVGSRARPATLDSVMGLYKVRCEQERKETEKSWSESEHECVICMDEIEGLSESLTMPCSHVFHEKCLKRWLDDNHVCPLCRFELPYDLDA